MSRRPHRPHRPHLEEEEAEVDRSRPWLAWKAAGVLLVLALLYWVVLGNGGSWLTRASSKAGATAKLSSKGEVCVKEASPLSVSCGEGCGASNFQKVGMNFSCWGGQVAVLPDLRPNTPATFRFPGGNITLLFPAIDVDVPLVQTAEIQTTKKSTPEVISPPVIPLPTVRAIPQMAAPASTIAPPIRVSPPMKDAPVSIVKAPVVKASVQIKRTCLIELSFTVSAMFASSPCFGGRVEWGGNGSVWHPMQARQVGPWYESTLLPPAGSQVCFRMDKKAYCANNVEGGGTYSFTPVP